MKKQFSLFQSTILAMPIDLSTGESSAFDESRLYKLICLIVLPPVRQVVQILTRPHKTRVNLMRFIDSLLFMLVCCLKFIEKEIVSSNRPSLIPRFDSFVSIRIFFMYPHVKLNKLRALLPDRRSDPPGKVSLSQKRQRVTTQNN